MYCMMSEWIPLKERSKMVTLIWAGKGRGEKYFLLKSLGHDQLLEIRLLEKSGVGVTFDLTFFDNSKVATFD
jgi:hypothetical protein